MATMAQSDERKSHCLSGLGALGGAMVMVPMTAIITTGRLMRNTEPHQKCSKRNPPMTGPEAAPRVAVAPQIPMAVLRSCTSVKVVRNSDKVAGIMVAAPMPKSARAAMRISGLGAKVATSEAAPKMPRPISNMRRWPILSPRVPVPSRRPDRTRGYMLMIHSASRLVVCRLVFSVGSAVYRMELSTPIINRPREITPRKTHRVEFLLVVATSMSRNYTERTLQLSNSQNDMVIVNQSAN